MLKYLNHIFKYKNFISFIIFNFLLKEITSISGTDSEIYDLNYPKSEKDEDNLCPCDMTEECDIGCICDSDCLNLMLSDDFFNKFDDLSVFLSDPENYDYVSYMRRYYKKRLLEKLLLHL